MCVQTDERARTSPPSLTTKPSKAAVEKRSAVGGQLLRARDLDPEPLARHEVVVAAEAWRIRPALADRDADEPGGEPGRRTNPTLEHLAPGQEPRAAPSRLGEGRPVALAHRRRDVYRGHSLIRSSHPQPQLLDEGGVGIGLAAADGTGHLGRQPRHLGLVTALDVVG